MLLTSASSVKVVVVGVVAGFRVADGGGEKKFNPVQILIKCLKIIFYKYAESILF